MKLPGLKAGVSLGLPGFAGPPSLRSGRPFIPGLKSPGFSGRFYKFFMRPIPGHEVRKQIFRKDLKIGKGVQQPFGKFSTLKSPQDEIESGEGVTFGEGIRTLEIEEAYIKAAIAFFTVFASRDTSL
jgi:hypothetical protein